MHTILLEFCFSVGAKKMLCVLVAPSGKLQRCLGLTQQEEQGAQMLVHAVIEKAVGFHTSAVLRHLLDSVYFLPGLPYWQIYRQILEIWRIWKRLATNIWFVDLANFWRLFESIWLQIFLVWRNVQPVYLHVFAYIFI